MAATTRCAISTAMRLTSMLALLLAGAVALGVLMAARHPVSRAMVEPMPAPFSAARRG